MRSSLAGLLGVGLVFGSAFATPAPALEAEQLRGKIEEVFALAEAVSGPGTAAPYGYDAIEVVPRGEGVGGGFRVTLSGFRVLLDTAESGRLDIGDVRFTMTPVDPGADQAGGEELFRVSDLSLPPRWHYAAGDGPPSHAITPGSLTFEGLWSFAYLSLMEARLAAADVRIETAGGAPVSRLETVQGELESRTAEAGRYDVAGRLRIDGITIRDDGFRVALGGIESEVEVPGHDPAAAAEALRAAAQVLSPDAAAAASTDLVADLLFLAQGGRMTFTLQDFRGLWEESKEALEIDGISLDYAVSNLEESVASLDMALGQTGLRFTAPDRPADGLAAALMPADGRAALSLQRLPLRTLLTLLQPLAQEAAVEGGAGDALALGGRNGDRLAVEAGEKLIGAMSDAGTTLDLSGTRVSTPDAEIALTGGLVIDAEAAFGVRGTVLAEVGGFDSLVDLAQRSLEDPDPKIRDNARGLVAMLALLRAFADRDETPAEGPIDRFMVKVDPNGALSVNEKPLLPPQPSH